MRTVDPELWTKKLKKPPINVTRELRFGREVTNSLETRLRSSLGDAVTELWVNSSAKGLRYVRDLDNTQFKRAYSGVVFLLAVLAGAAVFLYSGVQLVRGPALLVSPQSSKDQLDRIPFPGVAICSYNLISNRALHDYTQRLVSKDKNRTYSAARIRRNLLTFGALVTRMTPHVDERFVEFLHSVDGEYNVTNIMYKLSPKCGSLLRRCGWRGRELSCRKLFVARPTPRGFCCVFNSRYMPDDLDSPAKTLNAAGADEGLLVAVHDDTDDYTYLRRFSPGVEVLVFESREYPLAEGGALRAYVAPHNSTTRLALSARLQSVTPELAAHSDDWRGCRLRREPAEQYEERSYSWCLTECQRRAYAALCDCVPFTLPPRAADAICSPDHLPCISKHKEKFSFVFPLKRDGDDEGLSEELRDSLHCRRCLPDCERIVYSADVHAAPYMLHANKIFHDKFTKGLSMVNMTILRLFYSSSGERRYLIEHNLRYYEVIAFLSSQWMVLVGISLMSTSELVFYCTIRWRYHFVRRSRMYLLAYRKASQSH